MLYYTTKQNEHTTSDNTVTPSTTSRKEKNETKHKKSLKPRQEIVTLRKTHADSSHRRSRYVSGFLSERALSSDITLEESPP